jgi:NADP-dependent 3-hydroxy acid dehydrogenase YdfG
MGKLVLITGASAGIGEGTALKLAATKRYDLLLTARRLDRLEDLAERCRALGAERVRVAKLDVSDIADVEKFFKTPELQTEFERLEVLINNAGLAIGLEAMDKAQIADWQTMIDTNILGLLYVTRFAITAIRKNKGHIVNIGSVAGVWTYEGGGVYCATKAAVRALSEGLRLDMQGSRVRVTNIEPGMVQTDLARVRFAGDEEKVKKVYENFTALKANDIAECIEWSLSRPPHVNIHEMVIFPTDQAGVINIYREASPPKV